ncbi:DUF547 domain-containing protein [Nonlabens sp.]|uniref:DUF547 domain-containing protein n=1 Tax=Nonlabens sp. TaxID=1888209 RepID=UPI0025FD6822|nr:DUF547 domain-containing protein [Nonlabens sp.]
MTKNKFLVVALLGIGFCNSQQKEVQEQHLANYVVSNTAMQQEHIQVNKEAFDHRLFDQLLKKYVNKNGAVNYEGIKTHQKPLRDYLESIRVHTPKNKWSREDELAYYMNAYNAMTIDLIVRNYPLKSIKDIKDPWEQRLWKIGEKLISLEEIEHEILRKMNEPRIHFGINCASFSCPPLMDEAFTAAQVDAQLQRLAVQFINDPKRNTITADRIEISNIFKWFRKDFTINGDLIDFLNSYSKVKIDKNARVRYMDYNWSLNE